MRTLTNTEATNRGNKLRFVRELAQTEDGITARLSGVGGAAMVGTKPDGSVWAWTELTKGWFQIQGAGTVDVAALPEQAKRGRPRGTE
jgi:hypothetical protein